jgi:DNA/RNA-binding domain of Phe-tRNA-synthetase-like protein
MLPSSTEIECFNKLKGWRLHFAWLRLTDREHEAVLRIAIDGTVSIFQKKFFDNPYMDEPVVCSVRSLLTDGGLSKERCVSSFELLAKRVFDGQGIQAEKPGVVFRDLLSLKSMCPWSVMDISRVSFPLVFRMGRKGEMLGQANGNSSLNGCPVLSDKVGKIWTPITLTDETDIDASCSDILLVCYSPIEQTREVAAKTHLGSMVHMTQSFRFVIERAFLPKEEL